MLQTGLVHIEGHLCVTDGHSLLLFKAELSLCFRELCSSANKNCSLYCATYSRLCHELRCRVSQLLYVTVRREARKAYCSIAQIRRPYFGLSMGIVIFYCTS
jgi:hypothetical protein